MIGDRDDYSNHETAEGEVSGANSSPVTNTQSEITVPVSQTYPLRGLARANYAVNITFIGLFFLILLEMAGMVVYIDTLPKASPGSQFSLPPALITFAAVLVVTELLLVFSGYASPPLFCIWLYYAYANLPVLTPGKMRFSPGWAVGWLFVPAMNFFRPYQVVAELYRGSTAKSSAAPVKCWWGLLIASGVVFFVGVTLLALFTVAYSVEMLQLFLSLGGGSIFSLGFILLALAIIMSLIVIRDVTRGQETLADAVSNPAGES